MTDNIYNKNFYDDTIIKELKYRDFIKKKDEYVLNENLSNKSSLLMFYSNTCVSCSKKINQWVNMGEMYKNVNIYAINCNNLKNNNDKLISIFKIEHYPTFKIYKNKKIEDIDLDHTKLENIIFSFEMNF